MSAREIMAEAKSIVAANLPQACAEIVEWRDTAMLPDGVIRRVGQVLNALDAHGYMSMAENLVTDAALRQVAAATPKARHEQ